MGDWCVEDYAAVKQALDDANMTVEEALRLITLYSIHKKAKKDMVNLPPEMEAVFQKHFWSMLA